MRQAGSNSTAAQSKRALKTEREAKEALCFPRGDGLKRHLESWGEVVTGTRTQLLKAGIIEPGWFPGEPGNNKRTQRVVIEDSESPKLITGQGRSGGKQYRGEYFLIMKKSKHIFEVRHAWPHSQRMGHFEHAQFSDLMLLDISRMKAVEIIHQSATRLGINVRLVGRRSVTR